jgi:hypothetical protein
LFTTDAEVSEEYKNFYISVPISSMTKLKQVSEHALNKSSDPLYSVSIEMTEINLRVSKSQYEAMFKVLE